MQPCAELLFDLNDLSLDCIVLFNFVEFILCKGKLKYQIQLYSGFEMLII